MISHYSGWCQYVLIPAMIANANGEFPVIEEGLKHMLLTSQPDVHDVLLSTKKNTVGTPKKGPKMSMLTRVS